MGVGQLEAIAAEAESIPTLYEVAWKVLKTISAGDAEELGRLVSLDPALAVKVLRLANAIRPQSGSPVRTLREAILTLGDRRLRSLALAASIDGLAKSRALKHRHRWEHALAVGLAARELAARLNHSDPEEAYVCGLLHDVGKIILDRTMADEYEKVLDLVYNEGCSFLAAERQVLGFDHAEIGALVAEKWNLSRAIRETVRHHHDPASSTVEPRLCALVNLANALCDKQGSNASRTPAFEQGSFDACRILGTEPGALADVGALWQERLTEDKRLFGVR